jgi:hypothetical protein
MKSPALNAIFLSNEVNLTYLKGLKRHIKNKET